MSSFMSAKEAAEKWNISQRRVSVLCSENRIDGAKMVGNMWIIPDNAAKPVDKRTVRYERQKNPLLKPFVKWAGGKSQLIGEIEKRMPFGGERVFSKYCEPMVGGGALLFHMLSEYNYEHLYIGDINAELINSYQVIKNDVGKLIERLQEMQLRYLPMDENGRQVFYYAARDKFNEIPLSDNTAIEKAAYFIFLNKTCFNGLYRVNRRGLFNVPMGAYKNPTICDEENLLNVSKALQNVSIVCGDYTLSENFIDENTFVYLDPPYRPISETAAFTSYNAEVFDEDEQIRLSKFINKIHDVGAKFLLSNSDPKNINPDDSFFDDLYKSYRIERISAIRMINSQAENRGKINELLVCNYEEQTMYLEKTMEEKIEMFEQHLLETNRGFNFYVDWSNVVGLDCFNVELHALDALIGRNDDFDAMFFTLLQRVPSVVRTFPFLFALSKAEREEVTKGNGSLQVVGTEIDSEDLQQYGFQAVQGFTDEQIQRYLDFFVQMGLKNLFQNILERSTIDYVTGVLVGLDSNGRKNRGGRAFELACEPIIRDICDTNGIEVITQKKFKTLRNRGFQIDEDLANRKADFILVKDRQCLNIEVNFYADTGSKPEEIIDSYINRQADLQRKDIGFVLITDGNCWRGTTNQLRKGFRHLNFLMNYKMMKQGVLEEVIRNIFGG